MNDAETIIQLVEENSELKRGLGDIFITILEAKEGRNHRSIKNHNEQVVAILEQLKYGSK